MTIDTAAIRARAEKAKHSPWTFAPQDGKPRHCIVAQVFDENGHVLADIEPTLIPALASDTAAHIAGMSPATTIAICGEIDRTRAELAAAREKFTMHTAHVGAWLSAAAMDFGVSDSPANVQDVLSRIMDAAKHFRAELADKENAICALEQEIVAMRADLDAAHTELAQARASVWAEAAKIAEACAEPSTYRSDGPLIILRPPGPPLLAERQQRTTALGIADALRAAAQKESADAPGTGGGK